LKKIFYAESSFSAGLSKEIITQGIVLFDINKSFVLQGISTKELIKVNKIIIKIGNLVMGYSSEATGLRMRGSPQL
jgi:hypothetical protein